MSKSKKPSINDIEWTDYVLELLSDDEKIKGNPTTDGLRRIFELALDCVIIDSSSSVAQSPEPNNGNRATVVHSLTYVLNNSDVDETIKTRTVNGAADVYWGNCDKIFRNHPVAVAETRAEGRALRRGLRLRKVVAAEEIADEIEDDIDGHNVGKMTNNQLNFMDVLCKRLDINPIKYLENLDLPIDIDKLDHNNGVSIIRQLSSYQQDTSSIPENILGYEEGWK
jgi:hypothetical protein